MRCIAGAVVVGGAADTDVKSVMAYRLRVNAMCVASAFLTRLGNRVAVQFTAFGTVIVACALNACVIIVAERGRRLTIAGIHASDAFPVKTAALALLHSFPFRKQTGCVFYAFKHSVAVTDFTAEITFVLAAYPGAPAKFIARAIDKLIPNEAVALFYTFVVFIRWRLVFTEIFVFFFTLAVVCIRAAVFTYALFAGCTAYSAALNTVKTLANSLPAKFILGAVTATAAAAVIAALFARANGCAIIVVSNVIIIGVIVVGYIIIVVGYIIVVVIGYIVVVVIVGSGTFSTP